MKIGIIGAMAEEVALLKQHLGVQSVETIAGCEYTIGQMHGKEIVLLQSGIGKVNAAMSSAILMEKYAPDCVINAGSAGGFHRDLHVGDVVISSEVIHHDMDATAFGYEYGQVPGMPPAFAANEKLVQLAEEAAQSLVDVQVLKGLIATGDAFIHTPDQRQAVLERFPNVHAGEMEAVAIAQVASQFNIPFVIIRSLSDIAGDNSGISFAQYLAKAAENSAQLIMKMVEKL